MEFCIISPTAGLERYAKLSKTHLVLAHVEDPGYVKFYQERRAEYDWIILDNGAYETGEAKLLHLEISIRLYDPNVVVLPDYPLQPWEKTWHAAIAFLDRWYDDFPGMNWCYIPQAEKGDLHGFIESYTEATSDSRISWIGIPRSLAYAITDNPLMRVEFARMVRKDHPHLRLHAFGMVNGDVHELGYLEQAGVNSIDSSAPVWRGWLCNKIDDQFDRDLWDREGIPVDFSRSEPLDGWGKTCEEVINHNLEACGVRIPAR